MSNLDNLLYREYRFKFYLNANHFVVFNGVQGDTHPHTWEYSLHILISGDKFIEYSIFEKAVEEFFAPYQNQILNEVEPFEAIEPTLENQVEYFGSSLRSLIGELGGVLTSIEASETPTRGYIINYSEEEDNKEITRYNKRVQNEMIDT
ncbi:MAG: 6-carboxytetrahydropterin synthase, partial [Eubacterium sp.]|nr:6-carboxytetrahydropterin synthase [Eubacterium sp.]